MKYLSLPGNIQPKDSLMEHLQEDSRKSWLGSSGQICLTGSGLQKLCCFLKLLLVSLTSHRNCHWHNKCHKKHMISDRHAQVSYKTIFKKKASDGRKALDNN